MSSCFRVIVASSEHRSWWEPQFFTKPYPPKTASTTHHIPGQARTFRKSTTPAAAARTARHVLALTNSINFASKRANGALMYNTLAQPHFSSLLYEREKKNECTCTDGISAAVNKDHVKQFGSTLLIPGPLYVAGDNDGQNIACHFYGVMGGRVLINDVPRVSKGGAWTRKVSITELRAAAVHQRWPHVRNFAINPLGLQCSFVIYYIPITYLIRHFRSRIFAGKNNCKSNSTSYIILSNS